LHLPLTSNLFNQYVYLIHLFNLITYLFIFISILSLSILSFTCKVKLLNK
jgi:hypothetical protein